ncbi:hypothetical protein MNBD_GAMMA09-3442 [hydrothermal vent metagenome]|uniref:Uncharacterized protein n=1 Tax=hydrothermal vent metagenome TaxID=652676 RepID=A0A3B0XD03_9ZZZZ
MNIDLAKTPQLNKHWIDSNLSSVLKKGDINDIILLRAITTPVAEVDFDSILNLLDNATKFINKDISVLYSDWIWDAIIVSTTGKYFHFLSDNEFILIVSEDGFGVAEVKHSK